MAGLQRARNEGKRLGRQPVAIGDGQLAAVDGLSVRDAAQVLGVSYSVVHRRRRVLRNPRVPPKGFASEIGANSSSTI